MAERWLGLRVSGANVVIVDAEVPEEGPLVVINDQTLKVPTGPRERALDQVHQQVANYIRANGIDRAVVMASAVSHAGGTKLAHLESAEVRGVVMAAAAGSCSTSSRARAAMSKGFGDRKVEDYVSDDAFWDERIDGTVRQGSRDVAMLLLDARQNG